MNAPAGAASRGTLASLPAPRRYLRTRFRGDPIVLKPASLAGPRIANEREAEANEREAEADERDRIANDRETEADTRERVETRDDNRRATASSLKRARAAEAVGANKCR